MHGLTALFLVLVGVVAEAAAQGQAPADKTKAEVDALVKEAGATQPDWWQSVELDYPETLDLSWPVQQRGGGPLDGRRGGGPPEGGRGGSGHGRGGGGHGGRGHGFQWEQLSPTRVDDYLFQVVYPNPSRHKAGIKLVNHLMIKHKDDPEKLKRSLNMLGRMFYDLLGEYDRAAFWWEKCRERGGTPDTLKLARCYFELGSTSTARDLMEQTENSGVRGRQKELIKLWAKIGEVDKALRMIESLSSSSGSEWGFGPGRRGMSKSDKYLLAAEICRGSGRYDEAIDYYKKVLSLPDWETRPLDHHETDDKFHAKINLAATQLLKKLDLKRVPDGSYSATVEAYGGRMTVQVVCKSGAIESVEVVRHWESFGYVAMAQPTIRQIVQKQGFEGVDAITGATVTCDAIINGAATALVNAME